MVRFFAAALMIAGLSPAASAAPANCQPSISQPCRDAPARRPARAKDDDLAKRLEQERKARDNLPFDVRINGSVTFDAGGGK